MASEIRFDNKVKLRYKGWQIKNRKICLGYNRLYIFFH